MHKIRCQTLCQQYLPIVVEQSGIRALHGKSHWRKELNSRKCSQFPSQANKGRKLKVTPFTVCFKGKSWGNCCTEQPRVAGSLLKTWKLKLHELKPLRDMTAECWMSCWYLNKQKVSTGYCLSELAYVPGVGLKRKPVLSLKCQKNTNSGMEMKREWRRGGSQGIKELRILLGTFVNYLMDALDVSAGGRNEKKGILNTLENKRNLPLLSQLI